MSDEREHPGITDNPLAGVLDRLLGRERGGRIEPRPQIEPHPRVDPDHPVETPGTGTADAPGPTALAPPGKELRQERRMLAIAGPGTGLGDSALQAAAQWAALIGRRPSVTDLACGETGPGATGSDLDAPAGGDSVPRARIPRDLDRVRREPAEVILALLERLRRHECASDLILVRTSIRQHRTLMRAAFLSGALVLPVEESEAEFHEALKLAREVVESFLEISIWPFARNPRCLERFLAAVPENDRGRVTPFDPGQLDLKSGLEGLAGPPHEGFLVGLLAPEPAVLPDGLLQVDRLRI